MTSVQDDNVAGAATGAAKVAAEVAAGVAAGGQRPGTTRRQIYLRDGAVLLALSLITIVLFGVTLFLFRSFEARRAELGLRWSRRGRLALAQGHPEQAAAALRTALSYAPGEYDDQLRLALALAGAGQTEAANSYFLGLWEVHPGDGFLNLQLARLARRRGDAEQAVNYYRASIFGSWEQNGTQRRREVRLELTGYLTQLGRQSAAEAELLIAAGNAPEKDVPLRMGIADRLRALGDLPDALRMYTSVAAEDPRSAAARGGEGRVAYAMGDYRTAERSFSAAADLAHGRQAEAAEWAQMAAQARRVPELSLSGDLPARERAQHTLLDAGIAQRRLHACTAQLTYRVPTAAAAGKGVVNAAPAATAAPPSPAVVSLLGSLHDQWKAQSRTLNRGTLERDPASENVAVQLIGETEKRLAAVCGAPTGDDALLLGLAQRGQMHGGDAQ